MPGAYCSKFKYFISENVGVGIFFSDVLPGMIRTAVKWSVARIRGPSDSNGTVCHIFSGKKNNIAVINNSLLIVLYEHYSVPGMYKTTFSVLAKGGTDKG